jgi:hypothetical protein
MLGGCGSTNPKPDPARETRLVAETNALCASVLRQVHPSSKQQSEAQHRLAALLKALSDAWAYLPAGRSLNEAGAKRRALNTEARKLEKSGTFRSAADYIERSYRLELRIYDDAKALGLTRCLGKPPRRPIGG